MNHIDDDSSLPIFEWNTLESQESNVFERRSDVATNVDDENTQWGKDVDDLVARFIITNLPEQFKKNGNVRKLVYGLNSKNGSEKCSIEPVQQQYAFAERELNDDTVTIRYYTHSDNESSDELTHEVSDEDISDDLELGNAATCNTTPKLPMTEKRRIVIDEDLFAIFTKSCLQNPATQPNLDLHTKLELLDGSRVLKLTHPNHSFRQGDELICKYHDHDKPGFVISKVLDPGIYEITNYKSIYSYWRPGVYSPDYFVRYYPSQLLELLPRQCLDDLSQDWTKYLDKFIVYAQEIGNTRSCKWLIDNRNYLLLSSCNYRQQQHI
jgi:hypothetical protein